MSSDEAEYDPPSHAYASTACVRLCPVRHLWPATTLARRQRDEREQPSLSRSPAPPSSVACDPDPPRCDQLHDTTGVSSRALGVEVGVSRIASAVGERKENWVRLGGYALRLYACSWLY